MSNKPILSAVALAGLFVSTSLTGTKAKAMTSVSTSALSGGTIQPTDYEARQAEYDARRAASRAAFDQSTYSRCDARKYAWYWDSQIDWTEPESYGIERMTVEEAAIVIGRALIIDDSQALESLDAEIASVGFSEGCELTDSSLWYRDYQAFAAYQGVEVNEAKALIGEQLNAVGNKNFIDAVAPALEARGYIGFADRARTDALLTAFSHNGYGYCDAKKVAEVWGVNPDWAKSVIGNKLMSGRANLLDADIASTAETVSCAWAETGLSYFSAEVLSNYWGVSVAEAKARATQEMSEQGYQRFMSTTYIAAESGEVQSDRPFGQELGPDPNNAQYLQAFESNGFGYCDAMKLSAFWGLDYTAAKLRAGQKIFDHNAVDAVDTAVRSAFQARSCTWVESELTYADAERLAQYWDLSVEEAKNKVAARMSLVGHRAFVDAFGDVLSPE